MALLGGCGPGPDRFVGKWIGRLPLPTKKEDGTEIPRPIYNTLSLVKLDIKADAQFEIILQGMPHQGRWSGDATHLELKVTHKLGKPLEFEMEPTKLDWKKDGELVLHGQSDITMTPDK